MEGIGTGICPICIYRYLQCMIAYAALHMQKVCDSVLKQAAHSVGMDARAWPAVNPESSTSASESPDTSHKVTRSLEDCS